MRPTQARNGVKLPKQLLHELGLPNGGAHTRAPEERKNRRKAARIEKKGRHLRVQSGHVRTIIRQPRKEAEERPSESAIEETAEEPRVLKSILKKPAKVHRPSSYYSSTDNEEDVVAPPPPRLSKSIKDKLAEDDAEIRALERKLGRGRPTEYDGLDDILGGLEGPQDDQEILQKRKRTEGEEWLRSKRLKASRQNTAAKSLEDDDSGSSAATEEYDTNESDEELEDAKDSDSFEDFGSDPMEVEPTPVRVRENPYVAPVQSPNGTPAAKYVPPSLRAAKGSDQEELQRLRRQIQGLLNRLSEANMLAILSDIEKLYQSNPRHYVSTTLLDLLMGLLCDPTTLQDTFIILHAGFIAAVYKAIGVDFGAQIVQRIVEDYDDVVERSPSGVDGGKKLTNLVTLLAELYNFQVVGSGLIYDFIRMSLEDMTENKAELLLRIVRISGPQLRQDDPSALKDVVILLQDAVAKIGADNLSVRTKFMLETISNLKNNRMKTGIAASAITSEHTIRMKRTLGSLNTRTIRATEPLRIGLKDIRNSDKRGKWWLVGASYRDEDNASTVPHKVQHFTAADDMAELSDGEVDLLALAKQMGMNTDVRRSIFIAMMGANDHEDAYIRLQKLRLTKKQELEIPPIVVRCAGAEPTPNPFYTRVARRICTDRKLKMGFQFAFLDLLRRTEDGGEDGDEEDDSISEKHVVNLGKLFGALMAEGALGLTVLKNLNLAYLQPRTRDLVEVLLITVIVHSQDGSAPGARNDRALADAFSRLKDKPDEQLPNLIRGLQYFVKRVVRKTDLVADARGKATVRWGCGVVDGVLAALGAGGAPGRE